MHASCPPICIRLFIILSSEACQKQARGKRALHQHPTRSGQRKETQHFTWAALLILLAAFALRTWRLGDAGLSIDEMATRQWAQASFKDTWGWVAGSGSELPLYFFALRWFPTDTDFALRFPSALGGVIDIALLIGITARLYRDKRLALWAGALLAINPLHLAFSRAARPYPILIALSLAASYTFLRGWRTRRAGFVISSACAYLTHYASLALPLAQVTVLARQDRAAWLKTQILAGLLLVLWVLPLAAILVISEGGLLSGTVPGIPRPTLLDPLYSVWNLAVGYPSRMPVAFTVFGLTAVTGGLGLAVYQGAASSAPAPAEIHRYWLALVMLPILGLFAFSQFRPAYLDRYFLVVQPAVILLILTGWRSATRWWAIPAAILVLTAGGTTQWTLHDALDWRGAVAYVRAGQQPGDGILVDGELSRDLVAAYAPPDLIGPITTLDEVADVRAARLWVIVVDPHTSAHARTTAGFDPFEPGLAPLDDWLHARQDQVIEHRQFRGIQVVLLRAAP